MKESEEDIARDVAAVCRIGAVPGILRVICRNTGLGFAAVARVSDESWTACAVQDDIAFGLKPGGQLDVNTTLCVEAKAARGPIVIDHASLDPVYRDHHTPRIYGIESYISVPIVMPDGEYFGNLCAIDPRPHVVSDARTVVMFNTFAELIALQLDNERHQRAVETALLSERATAELREQFIAVLGHDLRNPLAAVGATAEVLIRRGEDASLVTLGRRLQTTTRRMARLIDDVMDFARGRLGSGIGVALAPSDDLPQALREVIAEAREANGGRVVIDHIALDAPVHCDRGRIQQLLSNLIGNALAYGAADRPVTVAATADGDTLVLSVLNFGEPIARSDLDLVFQPYWRPSSSNPGGGLGLGLYICSQIVKEHGGDLSVTSSDAEGTCFTARLPHCVCA